MLYSVLTYDYIAIYLPILLLWEIRTAPSLGLLKKNAILKILILIILGTYVHFYVAYGIYMGVRGGSDGKESVCNVGDVGSSPGLGRFPGGGHGNPLQYSCLENPHGQRNLVSYNPGVTKSQTQLSEEAHKKHKTLLIQNAVAAWQAEDHSLRVICTLRLPFYSPCGCSKITNLGHLQCQKTDIISHSFV